jgi:hypothetical protein
MYASCWSFSLMCMAMHGSGNVHTYSMEQDSVAFCTKILRFSQRCISILLSWLGEKVFGNHASTTFLKMEAANFPETLAHIYQITRHQIP